MPTDHIEARWRHFRVESSILQKNRFSGPPYKLAPRKWPSGYSVKSTVFYHFWRFGLGPLGNGPPGTLGNSPFSVILVVVTMTLLGASMALLGASMSPLGATLALLEASEAHLGATLLPLGSSMALLGSSLALLGASMTPLDPHWPSLEPQYWSSFLECGPQKLEYSGKLSTTPAPECERVFTKSSQTEPPAGVLQPV